MNTSIKAYRQIKADGTIGKQHLMVIMAMRGRKNMSLQEISNASGVSINAVCGRVNELKKLKIIAKSEKRKCRITGRTIQSLVLS
jgi:DNA-binding transcriptional regulator GbsR (MarR family)